MSNNETVKAEVQNRQPCGKCNGHGHDKYGTYCCSCGGTGLANFPTHREMSEVLATKIMSWTLTSDRGKPQWKQCESGGWYSLRSVGSWEPSKNFHQAMEVMEMICRYMRKEKEFLEALKEVTGQHEFKPLELMYMPKELCFAAMKVATTLPARP